MLYCNGSVLPFSNEPNVERKNVTAANGREILFARKRRFRKQKQNRRVYAREHTSLIIFIKKKKNRKNKIVPLNSNASVALKS